MSFKNFKGCQHVFLLVGVLQVLGWGNLAHAKVLTNLPTDGVVRFFNYHLNESIELRYRDKNGNWDLSQVERFNQFCRSRDSQQKFKMDRRLIELADHLADYFAVDVVEVISCYRSLEFNKKLKAEGHAVANESFHTKGMAMDIHLDEIREDVLRDYLLKLRLGGVGYYGNRLMVHMDFGPVRTWTDGEFKDNTKIGIFNKLSPIQIRSAHLQYHAGEDIHFQIEGALPSQCQAKVQRFFRGEWQTQPQTQLTSRAQGFALRVPDGIFGKFRLHCQKQSDWQNSNEFYIRKTP